MSQLSQAAAAAYLIVALLCGSAAGAAQRHKQRFWHKLVWLSLATLFATLIVMRLFEIEDQLREGLRQLLRASANYESRRTYQRPIAAFVILIAGASFGWWFYRFARRIRGRRNIAVVTASLCGAGMFFLMALRVISLHAIDALLYGPIKLNWVTDVGITITVLATAAYYIKVVRGSQ